MKSYLKKYGIYYIIILLLSMCLYFLTLAYTNRGVIIVLLGLLALLMIGILPATTIYRMLKDSIQNENERFLSILNLVMKLSPEKQDEMYIKIIESQLQYINEEN